MRWPNPWPCPKKSARICWKAAPRGSQIPSTGLGRVLETISRQPEILQNQLKKALGIDDGRRLSVLVGLLDKCGRIRREAHQ